MQFKALFRQVVDYVKDTEKVRQFVFSPFICSSDARWRCIITEYIQIDVRTFFVSLTQSTTCLYDALVAKVQRVIMYIVMSTETISHFSK